VSVSPASSRSIAVPVNPSALSFSSVFIIMWIGYKLYYKTELIPLTEVDLISGRREFDEDEAACEAEELASNKPWWKKAWEGA
jgi:amino acid transporter